MKKHMTKFSAEKINKKSKQNTLLLLHLRKSLVSLFAPLVAIV